ncbi:hypothetical protein CPC08DRAFT_244917 [Agrocybe pediades]|nr:hypothetical protein CPC08DRAFT_244917 [Agrocybe pediades]
MEPGFFSLLLSRLYAVFPVVQPEKSNFRWKLGSALALSCSGHKRLAGDSTSRTQKTPPSVLVLAPSGGLVGGRVVRVLPISQFPRYHLITGGETRLKEER